MAKAAVCVSIVTCNDEQYIERCLEAVLAQSGVHLGVAVVDNASSDKTLELVGKFRSHLRLIRNRHNAGFAAAQNQGIFSSEAPWVLVLNPDVLLQSDFVAELLDAAASDPRVGTVCGKLLSIGKGFTKLAEARIDSAGMYFTPAMRHFDRGWREVDKGQYDRREYVFGASGAAALYRREMIREISVEGEFFDSQFFVYREDADVAWRAQLLGWRCLYTNTAVGYHVRTVTPVNRKAISPVFNMHSVKNRFLMRIKNLTPGVWNSCWAAMTMRDLLVIGGCLVREPRSLEAFWRVAQCWRRARQQRQWIMSSRRVGDEELARWFQFEPAAIPAEPGTGVRWSTSLAAK
ncbi:MAG TPA: glycosyltransferase family 2 protein [Bryobacteraceae bacterium]|nr:glycosyltransferase family 2 protein [Bryobacteraceae bacterium]